MKSRRPKVRKPILAWTSGSSLAFHSWGRIAGGLSLALLSQLAHGAPWRTTPDNLISKTDLETLQHSYPSIDDADALQSLMEEIGRKQGLLKLEAVQDAEGWNIQGTKALQIGDIVVDMTIREFENELSSRLTRDIGQVDSSETRNKIDETIRSYLRQRGYYTPKISFSHKITEQWVSYNFQIDEGYPCRIREVITEFRLPPHLTFDVEIGDICDRTVIQATLNGYEEELKDIGYTENKILPPRIDYDVLSNSAFVFFPGKIGKKMSIEIESPVNTWFSSLHDIDPLITDPEQIRGEIVRNYKNRGYDDVSVPAPQIIDIGPDEVKYVYRVDPGPEYTVVDVKIEGLRHYSLERALLIMDLGTALNIDQPLTPDLIQTSIDQLVNSYNSEGFWDAKVNYPRVTKNRDKKEAYLLYFVDEGRQRILKDVKVNGTNLVTSDQVLEMLGSEKDEPLILGNVTDLERNLRNYFHKLGYLHASFQINLLHSENQQTLATTVAVEIDTKDRVKIGEITISGLVRTKPYVVERELRFHTGEWYDPEKIEETRVALTSLGLFGSVSIIPSDTAALSEAKDKIPYVIQVQEGKPGVVSFGPGWSFEEGLRYNLEASYNNLWGTARQVFFKTSISEEQTQDAISNRTLLGRRASVGYIEPYIFSYPVNGTATIGHKAEAAPESWEISHEGELALTHTLRSFLPKAKITGFYGQELTKIESSTTLPNNIIEAGNVRIGKLGLRFTFDKRDNGIWPTKGFTTQNEFSWARYPFGGDVQFFYWSANMDFFFGIVEDLVFVPGFSLASYNGVERKGIAEDILPPSERLHSGGADSNRGFRKQDLGPHVFYSSEDKRQNLATGGSQQTALKLELRYQLIKETLAVTYFVDSSNVFFTKTEEEKFRRNFAANIPAGGQESKLVDNYPYDFETLLKHPSLLWTRHYLSTGLALNYLTPLGSFNLSYGVPLDHTLADCNSGEVECTVRRGKEGKNKLLNGVFHINVGASF
jgi:outer membrane protein assembly complex protein YaeT